nr:carbon monoxide dehydrogenase subunit G [Pseudomonas sp.]
MQVTDSEWVPSPPEATWKALHDPEVLRRCVSGCETVHRTSDREYAITLSTKLAGERHRFTGRILLSDERAPQCLQVVFEGTEQHAGLAIGHVDVTLEKGDQGGTRLRYTLHAAAGGALAQIGPSQLEQVSRKLVDNFFTHFVDYMTEHGKTYSAAMATSGSSAVSDGGPGTALSWLMVAGAVVLIALYYMFSH